MYQGFGQPELGYGGFGLGSSQFQVMTDRAAQKNCHLPNNNYIATFTKVKSKVLIHSVAQGQFLDQISIFTQTQRIFSQFKLNFLSEKRQKFLLSHIIKYLLVVLI